MRRSTIHGWHGIERWLIITISDRNSCLPSTVSKWHSHSTFIELLFRNMWVFPTIGVPQNGWFVMENPIKMDDWGGGLPYFWKHPCGELTNVPIFQDTTSESIKLSRNFLRKLLRISFRVVCFLNYPIELDAIVYGKFRGVSDTSALFGLVIHHDEQVDIIEIVENVPWFPRGFVPTRSMVHGIFTYIGWTADDKI